MADTLNVQRRGVTVGILLGALLSIAVAQAGAQEADDRWTPWVGCWRAVDETATSPLLCVVPLVGEQAAVEMLTVVDGRVVAREPIFADGQEHEVSREECEGWERARFSDDSHRVYIRSELVCGARGPRSSTGVMSMVSPFEWLDVRTLDVDGRSVPWVLRYRLASRADFQAAGQGDLLDTQGSDTRMARVAASVPLALDDVIEATERVSAETVKVWVAERGEPFALDASRLIEMADAGVPPSVIDVVVAVSYPEKFVVNDGAFGERGAGEAARGGSNPFVDPFYDPYSRYGYYSPYGPRFGYGFGYYGGYGYGYGGYGFSRIGSPYGGYGYGGYGYGRYNYGSRGYGGPIVVVGRRGNGSEYGPATGRVVRGGGYTRASGNGGNTGRSARPRSSGSSGGGRAAPAASSARGSSPSPSSTGRRAQPRQRIRN